MSETYYAWADHRLFASDAASDGAALLFGADQASLFAIDRSTREVLERWRSRDAIDLTQATAAEREILAALCDAQLLVPAQGSRRQAPLRMDPAAIPLGTLVLEIAQACNLRCTYCYAGGGTYGGEARIMDPELARRAARFLVEASGPRERVTLVLFGGEPLLNFPAVQTAVEEAEAAANALGKKLVVSLTTNGTRFTPAALDFLRDHRVGISVSIDGPPDLHDANRRYPGKRSGGTYADVVAGLERLRAHASRPPAARVTLTPEQWDRVPEVFEHVLGLGFLEVGIAPASPVTAKLLPTPAQEQALLSGFSTLARRFAQEAREGRVLPFSNLLDLLARLHAGEVKDAPCGAGLGYLAMDAQGRFFLCHRFAGTARFRVGDLESGIDYAKIRACLAAQAAPRRDACAACWARSLCAGGCHYENHVRETELGLAPGGSCEFIRRWLELGIRVYAELGHTAPDPLLAFLGRRAEG
ncbi:MAG TPA: radical SAM protein [Casimicrobiaceae bacterium]